MEKLTVYLQGLAKASTEPTVTESELIYMAEHGAKEGTIEPDEREMIERIFAFENLRAGDIMIPRVHVFTLDGRKSVAEALPSILSQPHTRIPLHTGKSDEITQVVYLKDILKEVAAQNTNKLLNEVQGHVPLFVPVNQPIDQLFHTLRGMEERLVVVVDEYGALEGVFTLEDMLEELVGEIYDEIDTPQQQVKQLDTNELLLDGTVEVRIIEDLLNVKLTVKPTDSVNFWILNEINRIPKKGEKFTIDALEVIVEKASQRRIHQVRVTQP